MMCVKPVSMSCSCTGIRVGSIDCWWWWEWWCGTDFKISSLLSGANFQLGNNSVNSDSMSNQLGSKSLPLAAAAGVTLVWLVVLRILFVTVVMVLLLPIESSVELELSSSSSSSSIMLIPLSPSPSDPAPPVLDAVVTAPPLSLTEDRTFKWAEDVDVPFSMFVGGRPAGVAATVIIVGVMGVRGLPVAPVAKRSLPARGSSADCEDKLRTEPQLIGRVQSSSPKPLSVSDCAPLAVGVLGKGVARPEDVSRRGWG